MYPKLYSLSKSTKPGAYAGGDALGARASPPWENVPLRNVQKKMESSAQICRQKRMCTFGSDTTKLKRTRQGKKKKRVKSKIKEIKKEDSRLPEIEIIQYSVDSFHVYLPLLLF